MIGCGEPDRLRANKRLGRPLDYDALKRQLYADEANTKFRYCVGSAFVSDRIDRANPLDRVLYKGRWFVSGYIVSRVTTDKQRIYSQIVRLYSGNSREPYLAALVDLRRRCGIQPDEKFHIDHYETTIATELLVPLGQLQFVDYTPRMSGYFNPVRMLNDQLEVEQLRNIKAVVDEQRQPPKAS